jgi:hypothetical protein
LFCDEETLLENSFVMRDETQAGVPATRAPVITAPSSPEVGDKRIEV